VLPADLLEPYGADATRWYMYASGPPDQPRRFAPEQVGDVLRQFVLTLWNTYSFFVTYANVDGWRPPANGDVLAGMTLQPIDKWVLARLHALVRDVTAQLDDYDVHRPAKEIERFVDELSNWYVRRSRRRFWKAEQDGDKQAAFATLYACLTTLARLLAPFMPHLSEALYRNLVAEQRPGTPDSVHLAAWPEPDEATIDDSLLSATALLLETASLGRSARRSAGLRIRQPVSELVVRAPGGVAALQRFEDELRDELNVKSIRYLEVGEGLVVRRFKPNLPVVGRKHGRLVPAIRQALAALSGPEADEAARAVQDGRTFSLVADGQVVSLGPDDVLIEASSPPGYAVAESDGLLVALNTVLTPELVLEGQARDLVRYLQDARRTAALAVTDRITVTVEPASGVELDALLAAFGEYIRAETLADAVIAGRPGPGDHTGEATLGQQRVTFGLRRSSPAPATPPPATPPPASERPVGAGGMVER
jgi:isoleucyl-tRNA synthetase